MRIISHEAGGLLSAGAQKTHVSSSAFAAEDHCTRHANITKT